MQTLALTVRLKNFVKANFNDSTKAYKKIQSFYRKFIFPLERSMWKDRNSDGFESATALHMCSLLPKRTLNAVMDYYKPKTWLDVGCGTGTSLKYVKKHGIMIAGIEYSALAIRMSKLESVIKRHDLTQPIDLNDHFDVVWCYEVAEHLPIEAANEFLNTLVFHGNTIVLSAATPGQGGEGHINEQPASYWIKKMNARGFIVDKTITMAIHSLNELYSHNVYCYKKLIPD